MVDSQDLNTECNEEIEVPIDEEMFPLAGNSQFQQQQPNYEFNDFDSPTIGMFTSQTYAADADKVLNDGDFSTTSQVYELSTSMETFDNLAPGELIDVEVYAAHIDNNPTTTNLVHLKEFPSVEEMTLPGINFRVSLPSEASDKTSWMYSDKLQKLFVKLGKTCTFNVSLLSSLERTTTVRAMVVCSTPEDLHLPVSRCDNHRCNDNHDITDYIKTHVVRCKNEQVDYVGTKDGKTFEERLAVLVSMGHSSKRGITLEFVCQNSCLNINRRATALVFTLEDQNGQILGRQMFLIKISTNIRRDMLNEEKAAKKQPIRKRKAAQPLEMKHGKKVMRYHMGTQLQSQPSGGIHIKEESGSRRGKIEPVTIPPIPLPYRWMGTRMLEYVIGLISTAALESSSKTERNDLMQYNHKIRRIKSTFGLPNSQSSVDSD